MTTTRTTADTDCTLCAGTGSKLYLSTHPQCHGCYGTGIAGMTMTRLEAENATTEYARELALQARYDTLTASNTTFARIDSLTDQQRRDALIFLTGYADHETVNKACDYVTRPVTS